MLYMRHRFFLILFLISLILSFAYAEFPRKVSERNTPQKGLLYKSAWNKDDEYLFVSDNTKVLVRGSFSDVTLASGCVVILKSKLLVPKQPTNPGAFNYRKYLQGKGVTYYTYAELSDIEILDTKPFSLRAWGAKIRNSISVTLDKYLDKETRALVMAVMTGDTGGLSKDFKDDIQLAGLSHLMAVSGSHVIVFLMPFRKIFKNKYMNIWVRNALLLIPLFCFLYIADVTPSVFRSVMSVVVSVTALMLKRKYDSLNSLGLIGTIQLLSNPYVIYDVGFLLSYSSVFSIILIMPPIVKYLKSKGISSDFSGGGSGKGKGVYEKSKVIAFNLYSILTGVSVNLGILPFMCSLFNRINFMGVIFTCIASPVANLILIAGYLLYLFSVVGLGFVAKLLSFSILTVTFLLEKIVQVATILPSFLTSLIVPSYSFIIYFLYYFFLAKFILKAKIKRKYINRITLFFVAMLFFQYKPCSTVIFYDVGQGNCIYIETRNGTKGLIDAGEGFANVSELLLRRGVLKLDFIMVSHGHSDHIGGMYDVVDTFKIDYLFIPDNIYDEEIVILSDYAKYKGIKVIKVSKSSYFKPDKDLSAEILFYFDKDSLNNSSLMVKLEIEQMKMLVASDIEKEAESYFVHSGEVFDCDVLQVPHHGSDTSTTIDFLSKAEPEIAVICVGKNNIFGHPKQVVIDRLSECDVYRTDTDGAVIIEIDGRNILVKKVITDDFSGF